LLALWPGTHKARQQTQPAATYPKGPLTSSMNVCDLIVAIRAVRGQARWRAGLGSPEMAGPSWEDAGIARVHRDDLLPPTRGLDPPVASQKMRTSGTR